MKQEKYTKWKRSEKIYTNYIGFFLLLDIYSSISITTQLELSIISIELARNIEMCVSGKTQKA